MIFKSFQRMLLLVTKSDIKFNCNNKKTIITCAQKGFDHQIFCNKKFLVAKLLATKSFQSPYLWQ